MTETDEIAPSRIIRECVELRKNLDGLWELLDALRDPEYFAEACCENMGIDYSLLIHHTIRQYIHGNSYVVSDDIDEIIRSLSIYMIWVAIFNPNKIIGVITSNRQEVTEIMRTVHKILDCLPSVLTIDAAIDYQDNNTITFANGSRIRAESYYAGVGRGMTFSLLTFFDLPWSKHNIFESLLPTIVSRNDSYCIIYNDEQTARERDDDDTTLEYGNFNKLLKIPSKFYE